jgi:hypothetical protein
MAFRLPFAALAAVCVSAWLQLAVAAHAETIAGNDFTLTVNYLATYQITAQGTNVTVDTYDVSATCGDQNILGYCVDIGTGNLYGTPSIDSPFQVWALMGQKPSVENTVGDDTASNYLSTADNTYYADTHIMTVLDTSAWNTETNNACYANGTTTGTYKIGVGSLDYEANNWQWDAQSKTMDMANVGIVRGTTVSAYFALSRANDGWVYEFPVFTFSGSPLAGDVNGDGRVDINDLTVVLANYNRTGAAWSQGDVNGDGTVDINDLTIVLAHYGQTFAASGGGVAAVPEPGALALLALALAGLLGYAWRIHV